MLIKKFHLSSLATITLLIAIIFNWSLVFTPEKSVAQATSSNMLIGGDFEGNIDNYWTLWTASEATRKYTLSRAYGSEDMPFGLGSYSALISATGSGDNHWQAGLSSKKGMELRADFDYYLVFYAKAVSSNIDISVYLDNGSEAITPVRDINIGTDWEKYTVLLSPETIGDAYLSLSFGDLPNNASLLLDGIGIYEADFELSTSEVKGNIGDSVKLNISNINFFETNDIEIKLPYFDPLIGEESTLNVNPTKIERNNLYFTYPTGTYSGVGEVYASGEKIGNFTYNVLLKINSIYPEMARADEDMTIVGTGFHPNIENGVYAIVKAVTADGKAYDYWIRPAYIDSALTQITIPMPLGITSSKLYIQTSYFNKNLELKTNKSNFISYQVKPVVYGLNWSRSGYDQVGDNITITGKGISSSPKVIFYNNDGVQIDSKRAKVKEISNVEYIEVQSTTKTNEYQIKVVCDRIESDDVEMLQNSASPKLTSIKTGNYRTSVSGQKIYAAKVGETISLKGVSLSSENTYVEFTGNNSSKITVAIPMENIINNGTGMTVAVPEGAMNGYITAIVNNKKSNTQALELIPTILDHSPEQIGGGTGLEIRANGVNTDKNQVKVNFITDSRKETLSPENIWYSSGITHINLTTPKNISNNTIITITNGNWNSDNSTVVAANPFIKSAGFNKDSKILTIKGYGFSDSVAKNQITYMYANEEKTIVNPKTKVLEISKTEEGQEIKIQIYDDYHYGYITVTVDGQTSNETQFGPVNITRIARRVEYVKADGAVKGVLYISGYNLGEKGGVLVGDVWADVHYRNNFFIIAVVDKSNTNKNPIVVARE